MGGTGTIGHGEGSLRVSLDNWKLAFELDWIELNWLGLVDVESFYESLFLSLLLMLVCYRKLSAQITPFPKSFHAPPPSLP